MIVKPKKDEPQIEPCPHCGATRGWDAYKEPTETWWLTKARLLEHPWTREGGPRCTPNTWYPFYSRVIFLCRYCDEVVT